MSWRNVAVQIPADWGYGYDPGDQWCVGGGRDSEPGGRPFFTFHQPDAAQTLVLCAGKSEAPKAFGPAPEGHWRSHLTLQEPDEHAGTTATFDGWTVSSRVVDGVEVRFLGRDAEQVRAILASARAFTIDENGCAPTSKVQTGGFPSPDPAYDIREVDRVDSISVCQYQRGVTPSEPALAGSRRIEGSDAGALLQGLQRAPAGTGPDDPQDCLHDEFGGYALELLLHTGDAVHSVYLYYSTCFGNGTDDGEQHRELTADTCRPVFQAPVIPWQYQMILDKICGDRD